MKVPSLCMALSNQTDHCVREAEKQETSKKTLWAVNHLPSCNTASKLLLQSVLLPGCCGISPQTPVLWWVVLHSKAAQLHGALVGKDVYGISLWDQEGSHKGDRVVGVFYSLPSQEDRVNKALIKKIKEVPSSQALLLMLGLEPL